MHQKRVLGLGNPLIDICAEVGPGTVKLMWFWFGGNIDQVGQGLRLCNCEKGIFSAGILN